MIFASDLDRTLLYSLHALGGSLPSYPVIVAEQAEGRAISYISRTTAELLRDLERQAIVFIPVTTRTIAQYSRIQFFATEMVPKYAIVSNGGNVLIEGTPRQEWTEHIHQQLANCAPAAEVDNLFERSFASPDWTVKRTHSDELFYTVQLVRERLPDGLDRELQTALQPLNWTVSLQGRKLYLVPSCVNKGAALRYIKTLTSRPRVAAAGDSLLDESLLAEASFALVPRHGEFKQYYGDQSPYPYTEAAGMDAAHELITRAMEWFNTYAYN
ncbi:HAD family hydrolase [Paenibacillus sp. SYP-B4298]|uniref:HAD family hydrolase n=1 Tax=Paenibacillus sp. SYP-B4298 TaxID=2996034 RepID=UPI0022DD0C3F|nr:HAD family hydrolase [Paenibacillus sp. SYP-B4298]